MNTILKPTKVKPSSKAKFPLLMSYAFLMDKKDEFIRPIFENKNLEILIDSGAFTAFTVGKKIELEKYMQWLDKWKQYLFGYIALDVLGNPRQTDANFKTMIAEGFKPLPVHVRGDDERRMDELFEHSDWVMFGGLNRPGRGACKPNYVRQKMIWAKGRNVHWLGYTRLKMAKKYKPYSMDCSSWNGGVMFGRLDCYLGNGEFQTLTLADVKAGKLNRKAMPIIQEAGFIQEDLLDPVSWRSMLSKGIPPEKNATIQVNALSWVRYIREIRSNLGTRCFMANIPRMDLLDAVFKYVERTNKCVTK
jgi:hypothetical protein